VTADADLLKDDVYRFIGREVRVRADSAHVLDHIRLVYARFHTARIDRSQPEPEGPLMEVTDDRRASGEMVIRDPFGTCRLLETDAYSQFTSQDAETGEIDLVGFCDAATLLQTSVLQVAARLATDHLLLHAGAVSRNGSGVVLVASPGHGKTTLVVSLIKSGWRFLSDEVACLTADGSTIIPFPRSLILRPDTRSLLGLPEESMAPGPVPGSEDERIADIETVRPDCLGTACPLATVVFLRGFGERPRLEPLAASNGLFELLRSRVDRPIDVGRLVYEVAPALDRARCFNLVVGEPDATAALLTDLADGRAPTP